MKESKKTVAVISEKNVTVTKLTDAWDTASACLQAFVTTVYEIARYGLTEAEARAYKAHRPVRDKERYEKYGHTEICALSMSFDDEGCSCGLNKGGAA